MVINKSDASGHREIKQSVRFTVWQQLVVMDLNTSSENFSCFYLPHPLFDGTYERFITNLITAIINIITTPFAFIVNILIFLAIFDFHRLQTPSNLLLATLAQSDAFVGLTVQPGHITYRLMEN